MDAITKIGILVSNLGTPAEATTESVREYLSEFLSDSYIVDYPQWLWQPVLHSVILRKRPPVSAALYQNIWTENGSPLRVYSEKIVKQLGTRLNQDATRAIPVALGMRYGSPSLADGLNELTAAGVNHVILLPLYPQYSYTTTASTVAAIKQAMAIMNTPLTSMHWRILSKHSGKKSPAVNVCCFLFTAHRNVFATGATATSTSVRRRPTC